MRPNFPRQEFAKFWIDVLKLCRLRIEQKNLRNARIDAMIVQSDRYRHRTDGTSVAGADRERYGSLAAKEAHYATRA